MTINVTNNTLKHRFEVDAGPQTAFLNYRIADGKITFSHTEVPPKLKGRGVGTALVRAGLEYADKQTLRVIPQCPFVAEFLSAHPQYQRLVAPNS